MPGRSFNPGAYRYGGAGGQEMDNEISGVGNSYTAEYWQYDSRLMRRWNVDPVVKYHESPYATFANNPIWFVDPNGADSTTYFNSSGKQIGESSHDQLENAIVFIPDDQIENFNNLRASSTDMDDDALNEDLRNLGTSYAINEFKEFFNCNLCDVNKAYYPGRSDLYVNEHKTFLYMANNMVRIGSENLVGDPDDMWEARFQGPLFPNLSLGDLHTHPNSGLPRKFGQTYTHKPSKPDYAPSKPVFDIVVSDKLIYFINGPGSKFAVNYNKTFTTKAENPFEQ